MFSHYNTIPSCDRQTDGQRDRNLVTAQFIHTYIHKSFDYTLITKIYKTDVQRITSSVRTMRIKQ